MRGERDDAGARLFDVPAQGHVRHLHTLDDGNSRYCKKSVLRTVGNMWFIVMDEVFDAVLSEFVGNVVHCPGCCYL